MLPDLGKRGLADISADGAQEAAGLDVARVGDEAEADAAQAAARDGVQAVGLERHRRAFLGGALAQDAVIVRRAGRLELERGFAALVVKPVQGALILIGVDGLVDDVLAAAGGDQQKDVVGHGAQLDRQLLNLGDLGQVELGHGGVDLEGNAGAFDALDAAQGAGEGPRHLAERVVGLGAGAVQADAQPLDADGGELLRDLVGDEGAVGRHHHAQPQPVAVCGGLEDIRPQQRLSPGENHDRLPHFGNLVEQAEAFLRVEFPVVGAPGGRRPAVDAGEVAVAGGLPGDQAQRGAVGGRLGWMAGFRCWVLVHVHVDRRIRVCRSARRITVGWGSGRQTG